MAKSNFIQYNVDAFSAQLQTFKLNITPYVTVLSLTPDQVAAQAADAEYMKHVVFCQKTTQNAAQQWTTWRDLIRDGGTPPPTGCPVPPVFPESVPVVNPGVEPRFRALVKQIKAHRNYNPSIGQILGIEGAEQVAPTFSNLCPDLAVQIAGNRVEVGWGWQGFGAFLDICEIQVDRGDGKGFVFLTYDTTPGYVDTQPFPSTPTKWSYRAIYRVGDHQVGQWSPTASVIVGGA